MCHSHSLETDNCQKDLYKKGLPQHCFEANPFLLFCFVGEYKTAEVAVVAAG